MIKTKKEARDMVKMRWGDKFVCSVKTRNGLRVAHCEYNGKKIDFTAKSTAEVLDLTFKELCKIIK
jgi:hypothetical protein